MNKIIFFRIAWMIDYKGVTDKDKPNGAGSHVKEHQDGGEVYNFYPVHSKYHGYVRIMKNNNLAIERLGAGKLDEYIDGVTVVFFATDPMAPGQYVIGWYDNARLFRKMQYNKAENAKGRGSFLASTVKANGKLLPVSMRTLELPADGPGQANVWYVSQYTKSSQFLKRFFKFKSNPAAGDKVNKNPKSNLKSGWQLDVAKRQKIEMNAMETTAKYFKSKNFEIKYVHLAKVGWDMEAVKGNKKLLIEVKGTSLPLESVVLTPNEYIHSKEKASYRICILDRALSKSKSKLYICKISADGKRWVSECGEQMQVKEIKAAQLIKIN